MADSAGDVDAASRLGDDAKDGRETQAAPLALFFGGKEWFEDMSLRLTIHSAARIADRQPDIGPWRQRLDMVNRASDELNRSGLDRERAALHHRIPRVHHKVHQDLLQLSLVGLDLAVGGIEYDHQANVGADHSLQHALEVGHDIVEAEYPRFERLFAA